MEKKLIVIVDTDEEYLAPLEYKLLEEWEDKADIEVITQLKYFNDFFSQPRNIFMLVINEYLYNEKVQKQNCRYVFVLRENEQGNYTGVLDKKVRALYKYSSMKEIYADITKAVRVNTDVLPVEHTQLYMMYSPCGGSGKTIGSLGLCSALCDLGKRVLYINTEIYQDFDFYLEDKQYASASFGYALATGARDLTQRLMFEIGNEEFDYLRPFDKAPLSYQITEENYGELIRQIREMKKYDVIVLETSRELTREKLRLLEQADKIINICLQTEDAAHKNEKLLSNIYGVQDKMIFICNRYKKQEENYLGTQISLGLYSITEYIDEQEFSIDLGTVRRLGLFDTTAYLLD